MISMVPHGRACFERTAEGRHGLLECSCGRGEQSGIWLVLLWWAVVVQQPGVFVDLLFPRNQSYFVALTAVVTFPHILGQVQ